MGKNILTVDDSSSIRHIIKSCLGNVGYSVSEATDGLNALNKVKTATFDLLIVDVNMPKMDGIAFVKEVRKIDNYKDTPILMLTTEDQREKKNQGKDAGATGWLIKPFNPDDFIKVIDRLTGSE